MPLSLLLIVAVVVEMLLATVIWWLWPKLRRAQTQLISLRSALAEIACYAEARERLKRRQQGIEQAVNSTTDSVESIHRALTDFSFDLWGRDAHRTRAAHDQRVEQVYGTVRGINRLIGSWTSSWLGSESNSNKKD